MHISLPVASTLPARVTRRNNRCHGRSAAPGKCCTWAKHPSRHSNGEKYRKNERKNKKISCNWRCCPVQAESAAADLSHWTTRRRRRRRTEYVRVYEEWGAWANARGSPLSLSLSVKTSLIQTSQSARARKPRPPSPWRRDVFFASRHQSRRESQRGRTWYHRGPIANGPRKWIHVCAAAIGSFECPVLSADWPAIFNLSIYTYNILRGGGRNKRSHSVRVTAGVRFATGSAVQLYCFL